MKLSKFGNILALTYMDRMDVYGYSKTTNPDGTTSMKRSTTPTSVDVPCRLSFRSDDASETGKEDTNPISLGLKVFCTNQATVSKGDKLVVRKLADDGITVLATYSGKASLPLKFVTHQEIQMEEVGDA